MRMTKRKRCDAVYFSLQRNLLTDKICLECFFKKLQLKVIQLEVRRKEGERNGEKGRRKGARYDHSRAEI